MTEADKSDLGIIKIHNNVIASIAYLATLEIDGVSRVCDDMKSRILRLIGKKTQSGAIDIRQEKNEEISVIVPVILKYGYKIPDVATKIQDRVKAAVEEATDLVIRDVVIKIKGVDK
ncbi:MAG: Asp23/Gls24 family envelope stress response protein [Candidatus Omnitrophica bacterium]|nr:Asp23/Gls24 family envelope stress response protein [Candidatus Omnitrophota bacterium]MDD5574034.1 Asp23/Gls24 family envelope stress response protein [Candidatus Omnitrophota bacterium]